ncbi:hypothetical protein ACQP0C_41555 (plasmid) [Nocardia sp. CA-129566]|uniref:hypothetical protein n=1 Tax=Nocardia sp. CA-129566 TaxID=3239976 RepID=UPI003D985156
MRSLEQRFGDVLEELRLLPRDATTITRIAEIGRALAQLDKELRTTVPAGPRHDELTKFSREARSKKIQAYSLAVTGRDADRAAAARKRYALEHPTTVLDAAPPLEGTRRHLRGIECRGTPAKAFTRSRIERGYSR